MATIAPETVNTAEPLAASGAAFKDQVERSMSAMRDLSSLSTKNFEAVVASMTAAAKGAESIGARAVAYSKKTVEDQVAAAKTLSSAKSVQEVIELQTAFARSAFEGYIAEVTKMGEAFTASVKESVKPISARVTAVVERAQAAR
ncbi:MAG: phasin family protein [Caulobacteraceae bacterium]